MNYGLKFWVSYTSYSQWLVGCQLFMVLPVSHESGAFLFIFKVLGWMLWEVVQTAPQETFEREKTNSRAKCKCFVKDGNYQMERVECWCLSSSPDQSSACRLVHNKPFQVSWEILREFAFILVSAVMYVSCFARAMTSTSVTVIMSSPQQLVFNIQTMRLLFLRAGEIMVPKQKQYMKRDKEVVFAHIISEKSTEAHQRSGNTKGLFHSWESKPSSLWWIHQTCWMISHRNFPKSFYSFLNMSHLFCTA